MITNIGIYSPNYPGFNSDGGIGTYTRDLGRALSAAGHNVHVLTLGTFPHGSDGLVTVHSARSEYFRGFERVFPGSGPCYRIGEAMGRLVRQFGLDIVEFAAWEGFGLWYAMGRPAPLVVRLHTSSAMSHAIEGARSLRVGEWDARRERWLAMMADRLVTHSFVHREAMARELKIDPDRIAVIPHGVPVSPDFRRPDRLPGSLTVVCLGRMGGRKGTLDLIRSVPGVIDIVPDVRFVFIGEDRAHCPGGRTHQQYIMDELPGHARSKIDMLGRLPDDEVDRYMQSADLFVIPSHYESFGLSTLEAMRWGTPVIGTTAGAIPEVISDGKTGLLVPPGNVARLTGAIIYALGDRDLRCRLGEAGRRRTEAEFSAEVMSRNVANLYAEVIRSSR